MILYKAFYRFARLLLIKKAKIYKLQSLIEVEDHRDLKTTNQSSPDKTLSPKKVCSGKDIVLQLSEFQKLFKFEAFQSGEQVFQGFGLK